jgi:hypothetical protein
VRFYPANNSNPSIGNKMSKVWGVLNLGQFNFSTENIQNEIWWIIDNNYGSHNPIFDAADPNGTGHGIVCYPD